MADAHIPKFGNRDTNGNVPYTQYFDKTRKGRNEEKFINPNDPRENPDAFSEDEPPVHAPVHRTGSDTEASKPNNKRPTGREDDQPSNSPIIHDPVARKPTPDSHQYRHGDRTNSGDPQRKVSRIGGGSDRSTEHSPLHPHYQLRSTGKGGASSPFQERKISSDGTHGPAPNTPGRSKFRTGGRGDETPEKSSEIPKFGEWEKDPSSADGYTGIFNIVAEERQSGSAHVPVNASIYRKGNKQDIASTAWPFPEDLMVHLNFFLRAAVASACSENEECLCEDMKIWF